MTLSMAEVFYGKSEAAAAATSPDASKPVTALGADAGAGADGKAAAAPADADKSKGQEGEKKSDAEVLYGDPKIFDSELERHAGDEFARIAAAGMLSPEQRAEFVRETGGIFQSLGVSASDAGPWMNLYTTTLLNPPDEQTDQQWRTEGLATVNQKYGHQDAHRRLTRVNEYLKLPENETLRAELISTRLANHPKVIAAFCDIADKLKIPKK